MDWTEFFAAQLEREARISRRVPERVPEGRPEWSTSPRRGGCSIDEPSADDARF